MVWPKKCKVVRIHQHMLFADDVSTDSRCDVELIKKRKMKKNALIFGDVHPCFQKRRASTMH